MTDDVEGNQHVYGIELPKDSILTGQIAVISFIDAEGKERWDARIMGPTMAQSQIIGLLEMAKHAFTVGQ